MIKDILFVLKMFGLTVIVAMIMQARVGEKTLEDEFHHILKTSVLVDPIQEAVDGGIAATRAGYRQADAGIRKILSKVSRRREDSRERGLHSIVNIKRHYEDKENENEYFEEAAKTLPVKQPEVPTKTSSSSPRGIQF